ncbi:MAG TPA: hypothetical protein VE133_08955, partial [Candidatus Sulfotelmatobacter sp.]|nr:hypothetical protein [Candidatus Sulfotelmatobacter sp.]
SACIIMDETLTSGLKSGYVFELVNDGNKPSSAYTLTATPESNATGRCAVNSTQSGELNFSLPGTPASLGGRSLGAGSSSGCDN